MHEDGPCDPYALGMTDFRMTPTTAAAIVVSKPSRSGSPNCLAARPEAVDLLYFSASSSNGSGGSSA